MMKKTITHSLLIAAIAVFASCSSDDGGGGGDDGPITEPFLGQIDWTRTFGGTEEDNAQAVVTTPDGGFAILGFSKSIDGNITDQDAENNDYWLIRMDAQGNLLWNKTYGGSEDERGQDITTTSDGGFAIVGYSRSSDLDVGGNEGFHDIWVVKVDANGNMQWEKNYGFSGSDQGFSIIQTSDGGYFVSGFLDVSASGGDGNDDAPSRSAQHGVGEFWGHKLDANGNLQWRRYFGGTNNDRSNDVLQTSDGGFLMVGSSESDDFDITDPNGSYDFWAVKVSATGTMEWQKSFGGSGIDIGYSVVKSDDGGYLIAGDTRSSDGDISNLKGSADFWVVKINATGGLVWEKTYGGTDFESARSISKTADGNYIVSGSSKSTDGDLTNNYGQNDYWLIKINNNGTLLWEKSFGGSNLDFAFDAKETPDGKLVIIGNTESNDNDVAMNRGIKDAFIVKIK